MSCWVRVGVVGRLHCWDTLAVNWLPLRAWWVHLIPKTAALLWWPSQLLLIMKLADWLVRHWHTLLGHVLMLIHKLVDRLHMRMMQLVDDARLLIIIRLVYRLWLGLSSTDWLLITLQLLLMILWL